MQKVPIFSVILFLLFSSFQLNTPKEKLQWLSLEEAEQKIKQEPRPLLIDLYTDWCGWCKVMDRKTYSSQDLIKYLNEKFYVVKLNAESKKDITWKGKVYSFNPAYKTHDIAIALTNGELAYPSTVIVPVDEDIPQAISGMLEVKEMEMITKYFGEKKYGKVAFDDYAKTFRPSWK
ncbi:MAG: DUF255 domain-containing protein [Chitinophagaceae bacterium]|jgi:thioredoxin-related protein|nr:DUF255 domain-containing protein [Chitinophagaceae bacterium]